MAAVTVTLEEAPEAGEECRAGKRNPEVAKGAVVRQQVAHRRRLEARDLGQRDEIHCLLRADRPPAGGQLRVDQAIVRKAGRPAHLAERVLVHLHAAHHEHGVHRLRRLHRPPVEHGHDVAIGCRVHIDRGQARQNLFRPRLMRAEHVLRAQ